MKPVKFDADSIQRRRHYQHGALVVRPLPENLAEMPLAELRRLESRTHHAADKSGRMGWKKTERLQRAKVAAIRAVIARRRAEDDAARLAAGLPLDRYPDRAAHPGRRGEEEGR